MNSFSRCIRTVVFWLWIIIVDTFLIMLISCYRQDSWYAFGMAIVIACTTIFAIYNRHRKIWIYAILIELIVLVGLAFSLKHYYAIFAVCSMMCGLFMSLYIMSEKAKQTQMYN